MLTDFTIIPDQAGKRIERVCAEVMPSGTRTQWQKYGVFMLGGKPFPGKTKVQPGQVWQVRCDIPPSTWQDIPPWDFPLRVLHESESYLVIEKPVGVSVHPSESEKSVKTIVNALVARYGDAFMKGEGEAALRPGIVHRLDKPTSGVLLVAKTAAALRFFQSHWDTVEKYYLAVVEGCVPEKGSIEGDIARDPKNKTRMAISDAPTARNARTDFDIIKQEDGKTLLLVRIFTGRTHQIRVHLSSIGAPIVGDEVYGGSAYGRLCLHACRLCFPDPDNGGTLRCIESPVPDDFLVRPDASLPLRCA